MPFQCSSRFGAHARLRQRFITLHTASTVSGPIISPASDDFTKHVRVHRLIDSYRAFGHYQASIDPLGVPIPHRIGILTTELEAHGLTSSDLDRDFRLEPEALRQFRKTGTDSLTLREIVKACEQSYCRTYSVEYEHIEDPDKKEWLRNRLERPDPISFSRTEKAQILDGLIWGGGFERLLATKFPTEKRYGLDGVEGLVPAVASLIDRSAEKHGVNHVVVGSCHRGRLALCGTVYGKPLEGLFAEFMGRPGWGLLPGSCGDVKTHLGFEGEHQTPQGKKVDISVIANPSHLESVSPVSQGSTHATQRLAGPDGIDKTLCLALHGDAAFTGQGVVYETLSLAHLSAYDVGGTVRLIVNNQIGFTANPESSRSTTYCTDLAKSPGAPVFHVNSDNIEELVFICQLAADWRSKFKSDVIVDIVCYRKFGHNEMDQPRFTQPLMYQKIASHPSAEEIYAQKLHTECSFTKEELASRKSAIWNKLNQSFESAKTYTPEVQEPPKAWKGLPSLQQLAVETFPQKPTAITTDKILQIMERITSAPGGFTLHNNLKRILDGRKKAAEQDNIDWTAAEALALGSLSLEGHHVRVLGEDAQRGTFSQRHATFHDQITGETFTPLANLSEGQGHFLIENSPLSEYGALGFEYGVTTADPHSLIIWEAQFGDFVNTAQVMIDNIISGAETKWGDRSGLVLSLPHGLDGQGPEHSSSRIERFLMLSSESGTVWPKDLRRQHQDCNMQIIYPTTPANYFHALRRQLRRDFRKREFSSPLTLRTSAFICFVKKLRCSNTKHSDHSSHNFLL